MTREEEIIKASQLYAKHQQKPFVDGAFWADKTMIEKAIKWLLDRMWVMGVEDEPYVCDSEASDVREFIDDFKKAMLNENTSMY